jgi:hypothetical protein
LFLINLCALVGSFLYNIYIKNARYFDKNNQKSLFSVGVVSAKPEDVYDSLASSDQRNMCYLFAGLTLPLAGPLPVSSR